MFENFGCTLGKICFGGMSKVKKKRELDAPVVGSRSYFGRVFIIPKLNILYLKQSFVIYFVYFSRCNNYNFKRRTRVLWSFTLRNDTLYNVGNDGMRGVKLTN